MALRPYADCRATEEHLEHMAINAECPWCGAYREDGAVVTPDGG